MSQMTALLGVLNTHQGDELILEAEATPQFLKQGQTLRLFLRAIPEDRLAAMVDDLLDDDQRAELADRGKLVVGYDSEEHGRFRAHLRGRKGERVRFVKVIDDAEEPTELPSAPLEPAPVAVASTLPRPAPAAPDATRGPPTDALVQLLAYARERQASDLHVASDEPPTLRVDGRLVPTAAAGADPDRLLGPLLSAADREVLRKGGSVDLAVALPDGGRFRLNAYRHDGGLALAARVLRPAPPAVQRLHLPVDLRWVTELPHGLVLFTGATGSGKSTTMASLVQLLLQRRGGLLITLEDPIEYRFDAPMGALVRQRELGRDVADFPSGLRDALREDPDVLLVGEMRDVESIQLALTAAETGHLVLASLHSRSAPAAVERIVDAYPPERQRQVRVQLADALRGVVAQQLLPRKGGGRLPALEVLRVNAAAAALIRDGKTPQLVSVLQTGRAEGMTTMERSVEQLVASGLVEG